jgi:hypothetical protein
MYATHAAMRRDIRRLQAVTTALRGRRTVAPTVLDGWAVFRREVEFHHHAEDGELWPKLRERVIDEQDNAAIDEMVRQHLLLAPALDAVAGALDGRADLAVAVDGLTTSVEEHLTHEERAALPLVEHHLTDQDWHLFLRTERRKRPLRERPIFLAWVLDDASSVDAHAVLRELPWPGRLVYRYLLKRRFEARHLWSLDARPERGSLGRRADTAPGSVDARARDPLQTSAPVASRP